MKSYKELPNLPGKNRWDIFMLARDESIAGGAALFCAIISPLFLLLVDDGIQVVLNGYASNPGILPEAMLKFIESFGMFFTYMPIMALPLFLLKFILLHKKRASIINSLEEIRLNIYNGVSTYPRWELNPASWPFQVSIKTTVIFTLRDIGFGNQISIEFERVSQ